MLIDHGYPPDKVNGWWEERLISQSPPAEAWMLGETHSRIWQRGGQVFLLEYLRAGYAASEASLRATLNNPEDLAELRAKVAEMRARYSEEI